MKKVLLYPLFLFLFLFSLSYLQESHAYEFSLWPDEEDLMQNQQIGTIYMSSQFLDKDILKISVIAEDIVSPVLGIAFHLNYDPDILSFLKYDPGNFLEEGGDPFYLVKNFSEKKKIIFGETLRRDDNFPLGDGTIVHLYFQVLDSEWIMQSNPHPITFQFSNGVVSSLDTIRQDLDMIEWKDLILGSVTNDKEDSSDDIAISSDTNVISASSDETNEFQLTLFLLLTIPLIISVYFIIKKRHAKKSKICQF